MLKQNLHLIDTLLAPTEMQVWTHQHPRQVPRQEWQRQTAFDRKYRGLTFKIKPQRLSQSVALCSHERQKYRQNNLDHIWQKNAWHERRAYNFCSYFFLLYWYYHEWPTWIRKLWALFRLIWPRESSGAREAVTLSDHCFDQIRGWSPHIPQQFATEATFWKMDCSEEVQSVSEEPIAQMELKKGMSIFIDVSIKHCIMNYFLNVISIIIANTYAKCRAIHI